MSRLGEGPFNGHFQGSSHVCVRACVEQTPQHIQTLTIDLCLYFFLICRASAVQSAEKDEAHKSLRGEMVLHTKNECQMKARR